MSCPKCGNGVETDQNYCQLCGAYLKESYTVPADYETGTYYVKFKVKDNLSGQEKIFEFDEKIFGGAGVLFGSDPVCDVVLKNECDSEIFGQHARLVGVSNHVFMKNQRNDDGVIPAFQDESGKRNWEGNHIRVDRQPFQVGHYTVCYLGWG